MTSPKRKAMPKKVAAAKPARKSGTGQPPAVRQTAKSNNKSGKTGYNFMQQGYYPKQRYSVRTATTKYDTIVCLSGEDYIDPLKIQNRGDESHAVKRGTLIYEMNFNPTMMNSPVMLKYSSMYQQFRFKKITVEYKPEVPVTTQGAILAVAHHDPTDKPPAKDGSSNIEYATSKSATFSQLFNPFSVNWTPREDKWLYCANAQADVAAEVAGKLLIFALGAPVLEMDTDVHDVIFGSMFVRYELEFKDLLVRDKSDLSQVDIYYDAGTIAAYAPLNFYTNVHTTLEDSEFNDGEIDECLVEYSRFSQVEESGAARGNVVYTTATENYSVTRDPSNAMTSVLISIFLNLADVFLGRVAQNLSSTITGTTAGPALTCKRTKLNPVRVNATVDQLVRDNKKIMPRFDSYVRESLERLSKTEPDVVRKYVQTHLSNVDASPGWLRVETSLPPMPSPKAGSVLNPTHLYEYN